MKTPNRMSPVRVLQVLTCDGLGGTEMMVATLVERIDRSKVDPAVVTLEPPGPIAERLSRSASPVRSLGGRGIWIAFLRLAPILRRERFDVVNAYGFKATTVVRCMVRLLSPGTRFVNGVRGLHVTELEDVGGLKSRVLLTIERVGSPLVDAYDVNSRGAVELLSKHGVDPTRLHYIPNGLEVDKWPAGNRDAPSSNPPVILCVARFVPLKRQTDLIDAAAVLGDAGYRFRLVFVGDGPSLLDAREHAERLGLVEPVVKFHGAESQERVATLAARSDIFCLPSLWEGMAGAVMEAMAAGLPVVGTRVNGIADLVQEGTTGLLVPPRDPQRLADALATLLRDPELRTTWGAAGRARIRDNFGVERMVSEKQTLFLSLASDD
jgi:L-malate glycosyltransferase